MVLCEEGEFVLPPAAATSSARSDAHASVEISDLPRALWGPLGISAAELEGMVSSGGGALRFSYHEVQTPRATFNHLPTKMRPIILSYV